MGVLSLAALEHSLAAANLRGQWEADTNRPQTVIRSGQGTRIEPVPAGSTHVWRWEQIEPLLESACDAMTESNTARRALVLKNPGLQRGTTHTMIASIQAVRSGEVAWAHRHVINALRFSIKGAQRVFTVVNGRELMMEPYDLILTPSWSWHDHHNETSENAFWLDALDVPFTLALNQQFYEESGEASQPRVCGDLEGNYFCAPGEKQDPDARPYRYPWRLMRERLKVDDNVDPVLGVSVSYVNPVTGGSVLPTIACRIQMLPPGFQGAPLRTTASEIAFVIEGEGGVILDDRTIDWKTHDCIAMPNWARRRLVNRSRTDRAILFVMSDSPILEAFGFLRIERGSTA